MTTEIEKLRAENAALRKENDQIRRRLEARNESDFEIWNEHFFGRGSATSPQVPA